MRPPAGFMMGNPNAKVKLVEIGALTCPHCREFDEKGVPTLVDKYVKSGQVSWEFRTYLLNGFDIPAALIARCNGAKTYFPLVRAMYKDQPVWVGKIQATPPAQLDSCRSCRRTSSSWPWPSSPGCRTGPRRAGSRKPRATSA